jgi:transposase
MQSLRVIPSTKSSGFWTVPGWHFANTLQVPGNILLLPLSPQVPELNPVEHLWDELREKFFNNRVFDRIDALENHLELALRTFENQSFHIRSIVQWPWIINALLMWK